MVTETAGRETCQTQHHHGHQGEERAALASEGWRPHGGPERSCGGFPRGGRGDGCAQNPPPVTVPPPCSGLAWGAAPTTRDAPESRGRGQRLAPRGRVGTGSWQPAEALGVKASAVLLSAGDALQS